MLLFSEVTIREPRYVYFSFLAGFVQERMLRDFNLDEVLLYSPHPIPSVGVLTGFFIVVANLGMERIPSKKQVIRSSPPYHVFLTNNTRYYSYDISAAPWLQDNSNTDEFKAQIGWMIESLEIDPHDSNHCELSSRE